MAESHQNEIQRAHSIAITAIANQFTADMFGAQVEYEGAQASAESLGILVKGAFDVGAAILSRPASTSATVTTPNTAPTYDFLDEVDYTYNL